MKCICACLPRGGGGQGPIVMGYQFIRNACGGFTVCFYFRHGGPPPKALHQGGLTMGNACVHGELKFSEGQPQVFTNQSG